MIVGICKFHVMNSKLSPGRIKEKRCLEKTCKYFYKVNERYWLERELGEMGEKFKRLTKKGKDVSELVARKKWILERRKELYS